MPSSAESKWRRDDVTGRLVRRQSSSNNNARSRSRSRSRNRNQNRNSNRNSIQNTDNNNNHNRNRRRNPRNRNNSNRNRHNSNHDNDIVVIDLDSDDNDNNNNNNNPPVPTIRRSARLAAIRSNQNNNNNRNNNENNENNNASSLDLLPLPAPRAPIPPPPPLIRHGANNRISSISVLARRGGRNYRVANHNNRNNNNHNNHNHNPPNARIEFRQVIDLFDGIFDDDDDDNDDDIVFNGLFNGDIDGDGDIDEDDDDIEIVGYNRPINNMNGILQRRDNNVIFFDDGGDHTGRIDINNLDIGAFLRHFSERYEGLNERERERLIDTLPTRTLTQDDIQSKSCRICLTQFDVGDQLRTLPCFHQFHVRCVDQWFRTKLNCPTCRHSIQQR